jgi:hypothetical protein
MCFAHFIDAYSLRKIVSRYDRRPVYVMVDAPELWDPRDVYSVPVFRIARVSWYFQCSSDVPGYSALDPENHAGMQV